ncbi:Fe(3+)-siderophore ABC transporter permease [Brachybacterium sp. JB7]|nr:Fe(3+)-siderophore ABC transporter permease [Brachybacterium sp. JB7]RCS76124.1 Fe(3+)-siderophore ABC transporter permease [Brachybacterium alimentarium]RCS85716.1 Fe(3+)-siderophore ABC transporter permease [Brachybacterium alimentarium]
MVTGRSPLAPPRSRTGASALRPRLAAATLLALCALLLFSAASLYVGSRLVSPTAVSGILVDALTHLGSDQTSLQRAAALDLPVQDYSAVVDLRLPRTVIALAAGAALGLAGALMQVLTRNPLAEPGILGVNAGAAFAVVLVIVLLGVSSPVLFVGASLLGALIATLGVFMIGTLGAGVITPERLTLAGVALGAVLAGLTSAFRLSNPREYSILLVWESGDLSQRGWETALPALPVAALGLVLALALAGPMNALSLGDDMAASLGADVHRTRLLLVLTITLLAGSATALAGPIVFLGLMAPHVARWVVGPDQTRLLPLAALLSAAIMVLADVLARVVVWPGEVPVGVVSALIGAPVLILLVRRRRASGL